MKKILMMLAIILAMFMVANKGSPVIANYGNIPVLVLTSCSQIDANQAALLMNVAQTGEKLLSQGSSLSVSRETVLIMKEGAMTLTQTQVIERQDVFQQPVVNNFLILNAMTQTQNLATDCQQVVNSPYDAINSGLLKSSALLSEPIVVIKKPNFTSTSAN